VAIHRSCWYDSGPSLLPKFSLRNNAWTILNLRRPVISSACLNASDNEEKEVIPATSNFSQGHPSLLGFTKTYLAVTFTFFLSSFS
jgi:hypothetical protein